MNRLCFKSDRELQLAIAIANRELAPTFMFCGSDRQAWFQPKFRPAAKRDRYKVSSRLAVDACVIPYSQQVWINKPESVTACEFDSFLRCFYEDVRTRTDLRRGHKKGRPKDSDPGSKKGREGGAA